MKVLITGDWQATAKNLHLCQRVHEHLLKLAQTHGVKYVINLGDLKDSLNPVDQRVLNFWAMAVQDVQRVTKNPMLVLLGNHDRISVADGSETLAPVLVASGAEVIADPMDWRGFAFVPFMRDTEALRKALEESTTASTALFFHADLFGASYDNTRTSTSALTVKDLHPSRYGYCIGGHIHKHQRIEGNVWYVGSPFCQDWGEVNQTKGFLLLDTDRNTLRFLASPIPGMYDPSLPGYKAPSAWGGCSVRVPVRVDGLEAATDAIERARTEALRKYPEANIVIAPYRTTEAVGNLHGLSLEGGDAAMLSGYMERNPPTGKVSQDAAAAYLLHLLSGVGALRRQGGFTLLDLEGENVLSFPKVKVNFDQSGITVVTGRNEDWGDQRSNGSGKTSLLSLPALALCGRTLKGQSHDDWRYRFGGESSWLTQRVKLPDGRIAEITRRRPHSVSLTIDSKDVTAADVQKQIEAELGITWEMLTSALYIDQTHINRLLAGTDKDRKTLFAQFLNLERFGKTLELVRQEKAKVRRAREVMLTGVAVLEAGITELVRMCSRMVQEAEDVSALRSAFLKAEKVWNSCRNKELQYVSRVEFGVESELQRLRRVRDKAQANYASIDQQLRTVRRALDKPSDKCPTCGQPLKSSEVHGHLRKTFGELETKLRIATKARATAEQAFMQEERREADAIAAKYNTTIAKQNYLAAQTAWLNARKRQAALDQHKHRLAKQRRKLSQVQEAATAYLEDLTLLEYCEQTVSREGLPAFLSYLMCPKLNAAAEEYAQLFAEGQVRVQFVLDGTDIDVQVSNDYGGETLEDQSHGETRMASLITAFALRESLASYNVLILDEPGEGLDSHNAKVFAKGLRNVAHRFGSLWVTTHNPYILAELSHAQQHLEVVKCNRASHVETM